MKLLPLCLPEAPKWRCWQFISSKHQLYINALMRLKKKKNPGELFRRWELHSLYKLALSAGRWERPLQSNLVYQCKNNRGTKRKKTDCMCSCSIGVQSGIKCDKMSSNLFTVSLCLGKKRSIEMIYDYCGKCLTNLLNLPVRNSRSHSLPNKNFTPQAKARFMLRFVSGENCAWW